VAEGVRATTPRPWEPDSEPTSEQLADWLEACTREERIGFAQSAIDSQRASFRCFMEDHPGKIEVFTAQRDSLAAKITAVEALLKTVEVAGFMRQPLVSQDQIRRALSGGGQG